FGVQQVRISFPIFGYLGIVESLHKHVAAQVDVVGIIVLITHVVVYLVTITVGQQNAEVNALIGKGVRKATKPFRIRIAEERTVICRNLSVRHTVWSADIL